MGPLGDLARHATYTHFVGSDRFRDLHPKVGMAGDARELQGRGPSPAWRPAGEFHFAAGRHPNKEQKENIIDYAVQILSACAGRAKLAPEIRLRSVVSCHVDGNARVLPRQAAEQGGAVAGDEGVGFPVFDQAGDRIARAAERLHADAAAAEEAGVEFDVFGHDAVAEFAETRGSIRATSGSPTSAGAATSRRRSPACAAPRRLRQAGRWRRVRRGRPAAVGRGRDRGGEEERRGSRHSRSRNSIGHAADGHQAIP